MKNNHLSDNKDLWQTAFLWLKACGAHPNSNFCKEEISTHPDYPSLVSLTDFLDSGKMAYKAVRADTSHIHQFNYPLLAHIKKHGLEWIDLVSDPSEWNTKEEIRHHWSGIVVYPEKTSSWNNENNSLYRSNEIRDRVTGTALAITGIVTYILSVYRFPDLLTNLFGLLSLAGLALGITALAIELGFQNQITRQVCNAISEGGCEKVLKSSFGKGIGGITPADASVLYFAAQYSLYLWGCWYPSLLPGIFLFSAGGILVAGWSLYTQAVILKKWCAVCISIAGTLVLQGVITFSVLHAPASAFPELAFLSLLTLCALFLLPVKQLIKTNKSNKLKLAELKKWKSDGNLFMSQWQQEPDADPVIWENDLLIGRRNAPLRITVACNPFCKPCARSHSQLDSLLKRQKDKINVQMRLLFDPGNASDRRSVAVRAILQKAAVLKTNTELQQMLSDWFDWMDYDRWIEKWHPDNSIEVAQMMRLHSEWVTNSNVAFTPTFFINGRRIPGRYSLDDIEQLIPQLEELFKNGCEPLHS